MEAIGTLTCRDSGLRFPCPKHDALSRLPSGHCLRLFCSKYLDLGFAGSRVQNAAKSPAALIFSGRAVSSQRLS